MFRAGRNVAVRVPADQWEQTLRFYDRGLGLRRLESGAPSVAFELGPDRLWVIRVTTLDAAEIWLEFQTDSADVMADYLLRPDVIPCDDTIAAPTGGFQTMWISSAANAEACAASIGLF